MVKRDWPLSLAACPYGFQCHAACTPGLLFLFQSPIKLIITRLVQVMQCVWFWLICRVAWRVLSGKGAADARSDDEG